MEEDGVLAHDDVGDAVAVIGYGSKPTSGRNDVRIKTRIKVIAADRCLRSRESPWFTENSLKTMSSLLF